MSLPRLIYWCGKDEDLPADAKAHNPVVPKPAGIGGEPGSGKLYTKQVGAWSLQIPVGAVWNWIRLEHGHWLAVVPGGELRPEQLWRGISFGFHPVEAGGMLWKIPVARAITGNSQLPSVRGLNAEGAAEWKVRPAYRMVFEYAEKAYDELTGNGTFTDADGDRACGMAFEVGYRMGLMELLALEILEPETVARVVKAMIDWPAVEKMQALQDEKKKSSLADAAQALGPGTEPGA